MTAQIAIFTTILQHVETIYNQLHLHTFEQRLGRTLALSIQKTIALALFKQQQNIATKKSVWKIFQPRCSYKTLVVNMNRFAHLALLILTAMLHAARQGAHLIKHTDSTAIPVCLNKNAARHKTMAGIAQWGHSGKGLYYGIKLHITTDLKRALLAMRFTPGNVADKQEFETLNKDLYGIFVADAGYVDQRMARRFYREGQRILFTKPRVNMRKLITAFQYHLYNTRMLIEVNFRILKLFFGLVTSLPRSVGGYFANYIYSILAYRIS